MKLITKISIGLATSSFLIFVGCSTAQPTISEESLGLRKVDLYSENTVVPDETKYSKAAPSTSKVITRAFQDAPPMIPHDVEGMLPITVNNNQCISCHTPGVAESLGALPYPASHTTNFRPTHKFDGEKFEKSVDNMKNEISIQEMHQLAGARFNCSQCHAPQSEGQLVENTFQPEFTSADGAKKSHWQGSTLTEGLDTLLED